MANVSIKPRDWLVIAIGAAIIIILVMVTVNELSPSSKSLTKRTSLKKKERGAQIEGNDAALSMQKYQVEYKVICVDCDVSYTNETGGIDLVNEVTGPWSKKITTQGDDFIHLRAQNGDVNNLSVTVTIKVNGKVVETETSNGRYAIADVYCRPKDTN